MDLDLGTVNVSRSLTVSGNTDSNATINLISDSLLISGNVELSGNGKIEATTQSGNGISGMGGGPNQLTLGSGQIITTTPGGVAAGGNRADIGVDLINNGLIDSNDGTILISSSSATNNGTIKATNGGDLDLTGNVDNNNGQITVDATSGGEFMNSSISGGNMTISGSVFFNASTFSNLNVDGGGTVTIFNPSSFSSVELDLGNIIVNTDLTISGNIGNDSLFILNSASLKIQGNVDFSGTGRIEFNTGGGNGISGSGAGPNVLHIGSGQTITTDGDGTFGSIDVGFVNEGQIFADGDGSRINFGNNTNSTNNGTIGVINGADLDFFITLDNTNGQFTIDGTSTAEIGGSITGGNVTIDGSALFNATSISNANIDGAGTASIFNSSSLDSVQLGLSTLTVTDFGELTLKGNVDNASVISLADPAAGGGGATLRIDGATSLTGAGRVQFSSANSNTITIKTSVVTDILSVGPSQTISTTAGSSGSINLMVINNGIIEADGGTITFSNALTNPGIFRAQNGGTITQQADIDNTGGTISILPGSTFNLGSCTEIVGGLIDGGGFMGFIGDGTVIFDGEGMEIRDVTIQLNTRQTIEPKGIITNNATILLNDTNTGCGSFFSEASNLYFRESVTINGTGEIVFNTSECNQFVDLVGGISFTNSGGHTLSVPEGNFGLIRIGMINEGQIKVEGELEISGFTLTNVAGGSIMGSGILDLLGGTLISSGEFAPGDSAGTLNIQGNYTQDASGSLSIEIGGLTAGGNHDQLAVTNTANLDGALDISLINAFTPSEGQVFTILTASSVSQTFSNIHQPPDMPNDLFFRVTYQASSVTLTVVKINTYSLWVEARFQPSEQSDANISGFDKDPDGDGLANLLEYAFVLDPNSPNGLPIEVSTAAEGNDTLFTITFPFPSDSGNTDLILDVESSTTLQTASWSSVGFTTETPVPQGNGIDLVTVKVTDPVGTSPTFYRLVLQLVGG